MSSREYNLSKNASNDRVIVLGVKEGTAGPLTTKGIVDNRLLSGGNNLHAVLDEEYNLWYLKFDSGTVPPVFQQKFTTFAKVLEFAKDYYDKRNIEIKEVIY